MGGRALKRVATVRKPRAEYEAIKKQVCDTLTGRLAVTPVPELADKTDFGDLDLMYTRSPDVDIRGLITELFAPIEIVTNGDVTSFAFGEDFQVDLIGVTTVPFAELFYGYGDFGCLLGRMVAARGLKFGQEGLWVRLGTEAQCAKLVLTDDPVMACAYLDIDYGRLKSCASMRDVFDLLATCRLFDAALFRRVDPDRPMQLAFLKYIEGLPKDSKECPQLVEDAIEYFGRRAALEEILAISRRNKERAEKINGRLVMALGVEPRSVGTTLAAFRKSIEDYDTWLDATTAEDAAIRLAEFVRGS